MRETDNRILTVTGNNWKPLQNEDMLGFMRNYVKAGGVTLETAGSLRDGKIIWGLAKLAHGFNVSRGDRVEGYLLFTSPHEVGRAIDIRTTTVRVVCANTMALAMAEDKGNTCHYRQSHMTEFNEEAAKEAVGQAHEELAMAERNAKILQKMTLSIQDTLTKVIGPIFAPEFTNTIGFAKNDDQRPKVIQEIVTSIETAPGAIPGTGWGILNGVTHWADHVSGREASTRLYRSWVGDRGRQKLQVQDRLLELAAA
jgi:phage/plasmid-like protein (TIGR03299 family)